MSSARKFDNHISIFHWILLSLKFKKTLYISSRYISSLLLKIIFWKFWSVYLWISRKPERHVFPVYISSLFHLLGAIWRLQYLSNLTLCVPLSSSHRDTGAMSHHSTITPRKYIIRNFLRFWSGRWLYCTRIFVFSNYYYNTLFVRLVLWRWSHCCSYQLIDHCQYPVSVEHGHIILWNISHL